MPEKIEQFNIVIVGVGGQGLISILRLLSQAAKDQGYEVKTSELHGLAQRGGSVEAYLRFGQKIYSPLVAKGKADLIIGLEMQECLKAVYFASQKTTFLINQLIIPIPFQEPLTGDEIVAQLQDVTKNIISARASEICQQKLETNVTAGVYLVALAAIKDILPLEPAAILEAMKKTLPAKHLEINEKTFNLAKNEILNPKS